MRTSPRRPHVAAAIDIMRPSQVFAPRARSMDDPRRWMRLVFLTLAGASALLALLGATARGLVE